MAELICPGCKTTIEPGTPYCPTCFSIPVARPAPAPAPPTTTGPRICADPDCDTGGVPPAGGCRACGLAGAAARAGLRFEWGTVPVEADTALLIGREGSPLADRLAGFSNVSRRHAEIRCDGTALTVTDLESTNGTFVNDTRIPAGEPTTARPGDRIRFGATAEATVIGASG
ncbi:FHA domain-containing protein [Dactylosporangium sp. NPDC051541]|uniref:FHA domain-containing protein n=1 Tax=Dactylosporangium sp. NPDC051541 TaxID=3363977 RepID=UPI00379B6156